MFDQIYRVTKYSLRVYTNKITKYKKYEHS